MREEVKNHSKILYENSHQILKLQNEVSKHKQKCEEVEASNHEK